MGAWRKRKEGVAGRLIPCCWRAWLQASSRRELSGRISPNSPALHQTALRACRALFSHRCARIKPSSLRILSSARFFRLLSPIHHSIPNRSPSCDDRRDKSVPDHFLATQFWDKTAGLVVHRLLRHHSVLSYNMHPSEAPMPCYHNPESSGE